MSSTKDKDFIKTLIKIIGTCTYTKLVNSDVGLSVKKIDLIFGVGFTLNTEAEVELTHICTYTEDELVHHKRQLRIFYLISEKFLISLRSVQGSSVGL